MKNVMSTMVYFSLIGVCLVMTPALLHAQDPQQVEQREKIILEQVDEGIKKVDKWDRQGDILVSLTILVAFLGATIVVMQAYNKEWCKISTSIVGAIISVITVVNTSVFPTDHRTLKRNVIEGRKYIRQMREAIENLKAAQDENNKGAFRKEIREAINGLDRLEEKMLTPTVSLHIVPMAYAQSKQPSWVSNTPTDSMNLYAVGTGQGTYVEKAKEDSFSNAVERIVEWVNGQFASQKMPQSGAIRRDALREYIKKPSEIVDTYVVYDAKTNVYTYYTLLKLNKKSVEPKFIAAFSSRVIDYSAVKVVDETIIEQRRQKNLGGEFQDRISLYVGDIHSSKPFVVVIFQNTTETLKWNDSTRIALDDFREKIQKENILFEGEMNPLKPEVDFSYRNQSYTLFGTVGATLLTDYLAFEVFRKTK